MDDIYVRLAALPPNVNEIVIPCCDGYSVYIDENLDDDARRAAYDHAVRHIDSHDWSRDSVDEIESRAHLAS